MKATIYVDTKQFKMVVLNKIPQTFFPSEPMERALAYCWAMGATAIKIKEVSIEERADIGMKLNKNRR